ncbi:MULTISPECIES: phosphoribosylanthranilate isomerase [Anaerolinea]|uniref:phosphoribosylanthranilate isomerase n=1 Tax=Anaerolinea TaxID=233189 RepID=UPI0026182810|nr:phosphoribosylanthranilate isomerase [Anaerolinea thermophila]
MIVKICGLTSREDALIAADAGADFLGFIFYQGSPRFVHPETCMRIVEALKGYPVQCVGVFVNHPVEEMQSILQSCGLALAQLSGDEPPETLQFMAGKSFKAIRPASLQALEDALRLYPPHHPAPAYLLDAFQPGAYGGTGASVNLEIARWLAMRMPVLLAGGLTPENVAERVFRIRPWGVDVSSGVESSPGRKDAERVRRFIQAVRTCERTMEFL